MIKIEPVVTIASLLKDENAEEMGLHELVENGYEDDMEELYVRLSEIDEGETIADFPSFTITETNKVSLGSWSNDRLYGTDDIVVFKIKGQVGWWMFADQETGDSY